MFRKGRKGFTVAVLAALLAAPLGAAEAAGGAARRESMDLWARLAGWFWEQAEGVTALWTGDERSSIDSHGNPTSTAQSDEGPFVDPSGRPTNSAQGDLGPYVDPNG